MARVHRQVLFAKVGRQDVPVFSGDPTTPGFKDAVIAHRAEFGARCIREGRPAPAFELRDTSCETVTENAGKSVAAPQE